MVSAPCCTLIVDGIRVKTEIILFNGQFIELKYANSIFLPEDILYRLRLDFGESYAVILAKIKWCTLCDDGRIYLGAEVL